MTVWLNCISRSKKEKEAGENKEKWRTKEDVEITQYSTEWNEKNEVWRRGECTIWGLCRRAAVKPITALIEKKEKKTWQLEGGEKMQHVTH